MNRSLAPLFVLLLALTTGASPLTMHRTAVDIQVQDRGLSGVSIDFQLPATTEMTNLESVADNLIYTSEGRQVPVIRRWIAVPPGHRVEAEVTERTSHQLTVSQEEDGHSYQPIQRSTIGSVQLQTFSLDPPEPVSVGGTIIFRGVPIAPVSIHPYQYSSNNESIIENNDLTVDFNFVTDGSVNADIRPIHDPPGSEPAMFLDNLVLNPPRRDYDEVQAMYLSRILIAHGSELWEQAKDYVRIFADWKRRMGYKVDILEIENIQNTGALGIRSLIRENYYNVEYPEVPISYLIIFGQDEIYNQSFFPNGNGGDSYYALMDDGNVYAPDICVGRFDVSSISELQATVNRSIRYEQEPFRDDDNEDPLHWYSKAIFTAENAAHPSGQFVPSMLQMMRWTYDRLTRIKEPPYTHVDTLWATDADNADIIPNTIEALQDGRSLALSRGPLMGCLQGIHTEDDPTETGRKHPFTCALTCLTATRQQKFFRSGSRGSPSGPIAALAMIDMTNTRTNQCVMGWVVRAIAYEEMVQPGWIQLYSKLHLWGDYQYDPPTLELVTTTLNTYRLLGDPSVNVFTSRPVEITASYPESIIPSATALNIQVGSPDGVYEDAMVCVRQVVSENQLVTIPGDDGWARFTIPTGWIEEDSLLLTITHPNTFPIVETIHVAEQEVMIELDSVGIDDGENSLIPGESRAVILTFKNTGDADADNLTLQISTEDPWISFDEEEIELEDIASDSDLDVAIDLIISPSSKPPRSVRIDLAVTSGETEWSHAFTVSAVSHQLNLRRTEFDGNFERGNSVRMIPELENRGTRFSPAATARLVCLYPRSVTVTEDITRYPVIAPENYARPSENGYFTVELSQNAIPGDSARFLLELFDPDDDEGFRDSVYFNYMIGVPDVRDPYGPDEYGYICFDSGDEGWEKMPVYEWIEINPSFDEEADFQGTRLLFEDNHEGRDSSTVLELPFDFGYYGDMFRDLVICTNGWIAFGEENSHYHTFRNWTIPGLVGPDAQIAVLWQDLKITSPFEQRGVYYYYDEHGGRFIVEWSNMQIFHGDGGNVQPDDHLIEFQVILYDPAIHPTTTGDCEIKMQYKTFDDFGGNGNDNQYMTIGLKNLDNTGGLQYRYGNQYSDERCMLLENETALLFTIDVSIEYGSLEGQVAVADDTSNGLAGVRVYTRRGYETYTGENGLFRIDRIAAGGETVYFELDDYNTMSGDVTIEPGDTAWIYMLMTYPLIRVSEDAIYGEARPGFGCSPRIDVYNDGIGDLDFSVERRYRDGSQTRFEQVWSLGTDTFTDFPHVLGCQFVNDEIYITYTESLGMEGNEFISVINRDGEEVHSFEQPVVNQTFGFIDLAYDGEYLYGGDFEVRNTLTFPVLVKFDLEGNPVDRIQIEGVNENELPYAKALAYDPINEYFYLANDYRKIFVMEKNGVPVTRFYVPLPTGRPNIQGMAWNPCDDDNMPLYIMDWVYEDEERRMRIIKLDPVLLKIMVVGDISESDRDKGKGLSVGFDWDGGFARLASISDCNRGETRDTLRIFEIGPDTRFLELIDGANSVPPDGVRSITMRMTAYADLEVHRTYSVGLRINHNARGEAKLVPLDFYVNPDSEVDFDLPMPYEFGLDQAYPNPFNSVTRIGYTLDINGNVSLKVFDLTGRLVAVLVDGETPAGNHNVLFKPDKLASGIYFYRLESGDRSIVRRMVLLR